MHKASLDLNEFRTDDLSLLIYMYATLLEWIYLQFVNLKAAKESTEDHVT